MRQLQIGSGNVTSGSVIDVVECANGRLQPSGRLEVGGTKEVGVNQADVLVSRAACVPTTIRDSRFVLSK